MNIGELAKFRGGIATDTISEVTSASGVTIDGVILKDNKVTASSGITFGDETLANYDEGTWVPTVTAQTGTITSYTLTDARYTRIGRLVTATVDLTITNKGSGAGELRVTLPITAAKVGCASAMEVAITGIKGAAFVNSGVAYISKYDYTTFIETNYRIVATMTYEV